MERASFLRSLNYAIFGDSRLPAVLFLHGFMGSAADWWGPMDALAGNYHCVAVDLPGHGASLGLPEGAYTIEGTTRLLLGLLDEVEIQTATLVGYSMGGRLALYLALRYPERCAGLFLESASPGLESAEERRTRRASDEEKAAWLESGDFEKFLNDWYRQPLFSSLARDERLLRETIDARRSNDPAELAKSLRGMGTGSQPSLWGELADLEVPTLAVVGELDEKFVGITRRMVDLCPSMRTVVVPGAGHNVRLEVPGAYTRLLKDFLYSL